jgi:hypothetical protein
VARGRCCDRKPATHWIRAEHGIEVALHDASLKEAVSHRERALGIQEGLKAVLLGAFRGYQPSHIQTRTGARDAGCLESWRRR